MEDMGYSSTYSLDPVENLQLVHTEALELNLIQ